MKLSSVKYLFGQGLRNVWTNRVMSFASFCILMVSLLLVGFSLLFTANINRFIVGIEDKNEIIVFINDGTTDERIAEMENELKNSENIVNVEFYSKEQALDHYKESMTDAEGLFDVFADDNPLPDSFKVNMDDISLMAVTVNRISLMSDIEKINAPSDFANLLTDLKSIVTVISSAIVLALIVVCIVIISNATRASVFSRRKEINIMKYVGANNSFIRIPFFIEGMVTGALAGGAAGLITWFAYDSLVKVMSQQMTFWQAIGIKEFIPFSEVVFTVFIGYIVAGALLGSLGSVFSTRKHLKV